MTVAALLAGSTALSPGYAQEAQQDVTDTSAGSELHGLLCEHLSGLDEAQLTSFLQGYEAGFLDAREPESSGVRSSRSDIDRSNTARHHDHAGWSSACRCRLQNHSRE